MLWKCQPRTRAKLTIIKSYLSAWFNILAVRQYPHVIYLDGFCGPGQYSDGEDGSPVIAARLANEAARKYPGFKATLLLIDQDQDALSHLQTLSEISSPHPNVDIKIYAGKFLDELDNIIAYLKAHPNSPTFSFIDPFGFGQSPFDKLKLLMHNESSELFVNFWCGYMNRFKQHHDEDVVDKVRGMVGLDDLAPIIDSFDPIGTLCDLFELNLKKLGRHTLKFAMRDEGNIRDNAFFFCGRQPRGFEKIKEAMWQIDPINGSEFSAHADSKIDRTQVTLFDPGPQTGKLSRMLTEQFGSQKNVPISQILKWVVEETPNFLAKHARQELDNLLNRGTITYVDPQPAGRTRLKNQWPPRLLVSFQ